MKEKIKYHNYLFIFGWFYYLLLPLLIVLGKGFKDYTSISYVYDLFDYNQINSYLIYIILFLFSFLFGSFAPSLFFRKRKVKLKKIRISNRDLFIWSIPFFIIGQYVLYTNSSKLFTGYLVSYDIGFLGIIATLNTLFLFFYIYSIKDTKKTFINYYFFISLIEFSIALLGLGSRMYVLLPCITIAMYLLENNKISKAKMLILVTVFVLMFIFVGIWRFGNVIDLNTISYIGVAEPMLTWISAESFFFDKELSLFAFPSNFLTSFFNFIPSIFLPNKTSLISSLDVDIFSPFGATSIIVSIIYNFGVIGSLIAISCLGFLLTLIRINGNSHFSRVYYLCICAIIPFQLFRDPIHVVNKMLFYNYLIVPLLIFCIEKLLYHIQNKRL